MYIYVHIYIYIYIYIFILGHKNAMKHTQQIMEVTTLETTAARPLTSHLYNHQTKTNKTYKTQLEKKGRAHK